MQVLRLRRKTTSKIELATLMLTTYCIYSNIKASKTDLEILAYFSVYGVKKSTKDVIIRSKILNSYSSLENTVTKLRKLGLLEKDRDGYTVLKKEIQFVAEDKMGIIIQLNNV